MLGLIAQRRNGRVIFAMEEPEQSLPPHVQKRVVDKVQELAAQALFTSDWLTKRMTPTASAN
ncbi:hypothetical protein [Bosea sp. AS-1]|uniref:hypothetical protein n=1 Tax=Bosea sp. AS-1 TaxID=2015316 RepID=UPI0032BF959E